MLARSSIRTLLALTLLALLAADADAQRGRGRGGGSRGGDAGGRAGARPLLPRPVAPVRKNPFAGFPELGSGQRNAPAVGRGPLLPAPVSPRDVAEPERELGDGTGLDRSSLPWTDPRDPDLQRYYFELCDHDANGWISFREAHLSLNCDRSSYAVYDRDRDGRIRDEEFFTRYDTVVDRAGVFPPPRPPLGGTGGTASSSPDDGRGAELLAEFDADGDGILQSMEIEALIARTALPPSQVNVAAVLSTCDKDLSGSLEPPEELTALAENLRAAYQLFGLPGGLEQALQGAAPTESGPVARDGERGVRITRPTPPFARLDHDGDGRISPRDLAAIQAPMHLSVRASAVLAAMDGDGDGGLSLEEFRSAFR